MSADGTPTEWVGAAYEALSVHTLPRTKWGPLVGAGEPSLGRPLPPKGPCALHAEMCSMRVCATCGCVRHAGVCDMRVCVRAACSSPPLAFAARRGCPIGQLCRP